MDDIIIKHKSLSNIINSTIPSKSIHIQIPVDPEIHHFTSSHARTLISNLIKFKVSHIQPHTTKSHTPTGTSETLMFI